MYLGIKSYIKQIFFTILWILSLGFFAIVLIGVPLRIHLEAKCYEYKIISEILNRTPVTEVGYLVNKYHIIEYNGWVAYWQTLDKVPIIEIFIPSDINSLKPIKLLQNVSYSIPEKAIKDVDNLEINNPKTVIIRGQKIEVIEEIK